MTEWRMENAVLFFIDEERKEKAFDDPVKLPLVFPKTTETNDSSAVWKPRESDRMMSKSWLKYK